MFCRTFSVANGVEVTFFPAGHILGAAHVQLDIQEASTGRRWRLVFSGDIGRSASPILLPPEPLRDADLVIMESTYGDRLHETYDDARHQLRDLVNRTARRRGKLIIPAFAVGRTQELVYALNQLDATGDIPAIRVFVDSPLAVNATDVFRMHPEAWNTQVQHFLEEGDRRSPFDYPLIEYVREVRRSKQLNHQSDPVIIISANGMAENGRILHHLKNNIEDARNTVLIVSFQAEHTLGRRLQDGEKTVRIFGESYDVRAEVAAIEGYSAHADQNELLAWADRFDRQQVKGLFLVHGEIQAIDTLAGLLRARHFPQVVAPSRGESFEF
ncbi:MAG: MBL fold metallo-hydrolase RNA specificity domain-containing protein [Caldilinea sp.]